MQSNSPPRRVVCAYAPLFPLAARLRSEPDLLEEAVAIFQGNGTSARLVAATRRARRGGLRSGMTLSQARALMPRVHVRARDTECENAAQEALLEVAEDFSPRVENAREGTIYLDIQGLERHYVKTDGRDPSRRSKASGARPLPTREYAREAELALAQNLMADADRKAGMPTWVGIASSKLGARIASKRLPSPTIIAPQEEAEFLAPLPLARLSPEAHVHETLRRWGIDSIGGFAALSAHEVASRLGETGQQLHEKARGIDPQPLVPYQPPDVFSEGMDLDWPLVSLEPFLFVARAALDRLCERLDSRGLACIQLELSMRLEPDGFSDRSILLPAPSRDVKTLLTLVRLDLERDPPGAPVLGFTFRAHPDRPRAAQLTLFGPTALSPDKLATSLARLFALLGSDGIGRAVPADSHLPGSFEMLDFQPPDPPAVRPERPTCRGLLAVRGLRPPIPLTVRSTAGKPTALRSPLPSRQKSRPSGRSGRHARARPRLTGAIRVASGPWIVEQGWWSEKSSTDRDYWDVELDSGAIYRIFRDRSTGHWFADGVYD
ncbi:MAG: hypothetical protein ACE5GX_11000 [Thermoanaerobaculia bacterium]